MLAFKFVFPIKIDCFKDLTLRTSFLGVMPIVIPFWKALGSPVLLASRYRSKNQWVINTSHHKQEKITFLYQFHFFSDHGVRCPMVSELGAGRKTYGMGSRTIKILEKCVFLESSPNFFLFVMLVLITN